MTIFQPILPLPVPSPVYLIPGYLQTPWPEIFICTSTLLPNYKEDIQTYVMLDGCWTPEELECKLEIRRLLREGFITPVDNFGYLSPHPTAYRTLKEGSLMVSGQQYAFRSREDLIFEPWLARYSDPGLNGPLRIGQLYHVSSPCLCCDSFPHICIHCDNTMGIMRQILSYRNNQK
jgi:hypothetical protein